MARRASLVLLVGIGLVAQLGAQAPAPRPPARSVPDLAGTYAVTGTAPDGVYTATAEIVAHGPVFEVRWTFPQGDGMTGVGFVHDGAFIVGFAVSSPFGFNAGAAYYRVTKDQPLTLEGTWTGWGHTTVSTERLVKRPPAIRAGP